ncbi:MAG: hydroxymethylbilane synthase [Gemmatimonadota bacterium]|nr:hydroxymethylbilane synthase [Gemmatimonadota bacterium]
MSGAAARAEGPARIVIGSRRSRLARIQATQVGRALEAVRPGLEVVYETMATEGDRRLDAALPEIGGKGVFTAELERALHEGRVDVAVHSLKDLPTEDPEGLVVAAILEREDPRDVLVVRSGTPSLQALDEGARVGTSSVRRAGHLRAARPDLRVVPIRGNVETRVAKVESGEVDAIVIAAAGLRRLGLEPDHASAFALEDWLPAPGQGALAVQAAVARPEILELTAAVDHPPTRAEVTAERALLAALGAGCHAPVGAWGRVREGSLDLMAVAYDPSGREKPWRGASAGPAREAETIGRALAAEVLGPRTRGWFEPPSGPPEGPPPA